MRYHNKKLFFTAGIDYYTRIYEFFSLYYVYTHRWSTPEVTEFNYQTVSDEGLISRTCGGDQMAFQTLVERYQSKVIGIAYGVVHNSDDAKDVAQNVFVKVYKSIDKFRGDSKFSTWLHRIIINVAIDFIRQKKKKTALEYDDTYRQDVELSAPHPQKTLPSDKLLTKELYAKLQEAVQQLPDTQRTTFVLREMENLSYSDIAEAMECSEGTVMSRLFYARQKIREYLTPYLGDK